MEQLWLIPVVVFFGGLAGLVAIGSVISVVKAIRRRQGKRIPYNPDGYWWS